jgi:DNA/RNA endonuclease YhcR with UshA esterase domain
MRIKLLIALSLGLFSVAALAQDKPADPAPTAPEKPATTAPSAPVDIVKEKETLKELIGKDATVRGKVIEVFVSNRSGVTILNFFPQAERRLFNVVIDKANLEAVNAGHGGDLGAAVKDKTILVTGNVADYRGNPQINVNKPEQIRIDEAAKADDKPAEEKHPEKKAE